MNTPEKIDKFIENARTWSVIIDAHLGELLSEKLSHIHIQKRFRIKTKSSLTRKIEEKKKEKSYDVESVTDIVGFRFVCHFQSEVAEVVDALLGSLTTDGSDYLGKLIEARIYISQSPNQSLLLERIKTIFNTYKLGIIDETKMSRYTSVHMVFERKNHQKYEVQIRNVFEDAWAEIEHALKYKLGDKLLSPITDRHLQILNSFVQSCCEYSEQLYWDSREETHSNAGAPIAALNDDESDTKDVPKKFRQIVERVKLCRDHHDYNQALKLLDSAVEDVSKSDHHPTTEYYLLMERGITYLKMGATAPAINDYLHLKSKFPNKALIDFRLADANRLLRNYDEAALLLESISEKIKHPDNTNAEKKYLERTPYTIAHTYWKLGKLEKSIQALENAYFSEDAKKSLKYINCYSYYVIDLHKRKAEPPPPKILEAIYEQLKEFPLLSGEYWAALDTYMLVCFYLKKYDEAKKCAQLLSSMISYEENSDNPIIIYADGEKEQFALEDIEIVRSHIARIMKHQ